MSYTISLIWPAVNGILPIYYLQIQTKRPIFIRDLAEKGGLPLLKIMPAVPGLAAGNQARLAGKSLIFMIFPATTSPILLGDFPARTTFEDTGGFHVSCALAFRKMSIFCWGSFVDPCFFWFQSVANTVFPAAWFQKPENTDCMA